MTPLIGSKLLQREPTLPVLSDRCFELKQTTPHALNGMVCRSQSRSMQALSCDMSHGLPDLHRLLALRAHRVAIYNCREMLWLGNASKGMQAREHWLGLASQALLLVASVDSSARETQQGQP